MTMHPNTKEHSEVSHREDRQSSPPRQEAPLPPERPEGDGQMGERYLRLFYEPELVDGEETYSAVYHFVTYVLKGEPLGQCFAAYNAAWNAAADHVERRLNGGGETC